VNNFRDKIIVITGAASGIGKGIAQAFAADGAKLVLSDIAAEPLETLGSELRQSGCEVTTHVCDVSDADQVEQLAEFTYQSFGACHVLCNNAGVVENNLKAWELTLEDWNWVLGINLMGVVHGVRSFVPRMLASNEAGHVVNTASIGGLISGLALPAYSVSKHAVVAFSECLYNDLSRESAEVTASVLCPGWVNTDIADSDRNREARPEMSEENLRSRNAFKQSISNGLEPIEVGHIVTNGIKEKQFYLYTHPSWNTVVADRFDAIMDGKKPASTYLPRG
jgi:NAD(P)-dependent dehydrogenase (short-subunit alcohol dehydrogenase family)